MSKDATHSHRRVAHGRTTKSLTTDDPREKVYKTTRGLPMPKNKQKSDLISDYLKRIRKHHKKWPEPKDAEAIFDMHFAVRSHSRRVFHAEMTLEVPQPDREGVTVYYTIAATGSTEAYALRKVLELMESQMWYRYFRNKGVRFRVTGVFEKLYKGYL